MMRAQLTVNDHRMHNERLQTFIRQSELTIHSEALWHRDSKERERLTEKDKERQGEKRHSQTLLDVTRLVMLRWITGKAPKQNASFTPLVSVVRNRPQYKKWTKKFIQHSSWKYTPTPPSHSLHLKTHLCKVPLHTLPILCIHLLKITALVPKCTINYVFKQGTMGITGGQPPILVLPGKQWSEDMLHNHSLPYTLSLWLFYYRKSLKGKYIWQPVAWHDGCCSGVPLGESMGRVC